MFEIVTGSDGEILISGRFDASQVDGAKGILDDLKDSAVVDCENLTYISSAGLNLLLGTEKRLRQAGHRLKLRNMNSHIKELFMYTGLDMVFDIEDLSE